VLISIGIAYVFCNVSIELHFAMNPILQCSLN